ncbi:MAG: hypothetical protein P8188_07575 [Gemmatimonadota bacterium]
MTGPAASGNVVADRGAPQPLHSPSLRERYESYRRAQGRALLDLLSREGLRSVLRHPGGALDAAAPGMEGAPPSDDLGALALRCADLLPLPPFPVWVEDFHRHRRAYVDQPGPPLAPEAEDGRPVTVDVRTLRHRGQVWVAGLAVRRVGALWVGHVPFHRPGEPGSVQTGEILREDSPLAVRQRFQEFDERTLQALLRSALP